jgi:hypothetical protein
MQLEDLLKTPLPELPDMDSSGYPGALDEGVGMLRGLSNNLSTASKSFFNQTIASFRSVVEEIGDVKIHNFPGVYHEANLGNLNSTLRVEGFIIETENLEKKRQIEDLHSKSLREYGDSMRLVNDFRLQLNRRVEDFYSAVEKLTEVHALTEPKHGLTHLSLFGVNPTGVYELHYDPTSKFIIGPTKNEKMEPNPLFEDGQIRSFREKVGNPNGQAYLATNPCSSIDTKSLFYAATSQFLSDMISHSSEFSSAVGQSEDLATSYTSAAEFIAGIK